MGGVLARDVVSLNLPASIFVFRLVKRIKGTAEEGSKGFLGVNKAWCQQEDKDEDEGTRRSGTMCPPPHPWGPAH